MDVLIYLILPITLVAVGGSTLILGYRASTQSRRLRCAKVSIGCLGSALIIWFVYALAPLLQLLVIFLATGWFAKRVALQGPSLGFGPALRALRNVRA
jgi:hypothetical protein